MNEGHKLRAVSLKKTTSKETSSSTKKISLEDELVKELEWKENPIVIFSLILFVMHHICTLYTFKFLVQITSCPVGSMVTGKWMFHSGSVLSLVFAWIVEKGNNKFDFILILSTLLTFLSSTLVIVIIFDDGKGSLFCPMARVVYMIVDASMGTTFAFFLEQVKFLKFQLDTNCMLFIVIWGSFFIASSLTVVYQLVIHFYGYVHFYYTVSIVSMVCCINKVIFLLMIARRIFRPTVPSNLPYMAILYMILQVKSLCKKRTLSKRSSEPVTIPLAVIVICEQFWKVFGVVIFIIPFGISNLILTNIWQYAWDMRKERFIYCKNFTAFYNFSTTALFPLYFVGMYFSNIYEKLTTELKQMGFGNIIVILSLVVFTVLNFHIDEYPFALPSDGYSQIRFFNILNTTTYVKFRCMEGTMGPHDYITFSKIHMDGSFINAAIKLTNKENGLNLKTSVVGSNGKSICYYIHQSGLVYLGTEPLTSNSNHITFKSATVYFISDISDIKFKFQHQRESMIFNVTGHLHKLKYIYVKKGSYIISVTHENDSTVHRSVILDEASFYAILVTKSTSELIFRVFTIYSPRFAPIEGMVLVAGLLGLGNSIVLFSVVRFILSESSPLLYATLFAVNYICQHLVTLIYSYLNITHIIGGQIAIMYLALTVSILFFIFYIYIAVMYQYLRDRIFEVAPSPSQVTAITDQQEEIDETLEDDLDK